MKPKTRYVTHRVQIATAAALLLNITASPADAADRWWDGGTADIAGPGDGASAGTAGTWNTTVQNWDQGSGLAHLAWDNVANDTAMFAGTSGTVTLGSAIAANALVFQVSNYTLSGAQTLTLSGTAPRISNSGTATINTNLAGNAGLTKQAAGTLIVRGTASHGLTGGVTANGGILELDFLNFATPTNLIDSGNSATLGGGTLRVKGKSTGTSSQTLNGVTLNGGHSGISLNSNGGTGNFALGAITRNPGGSVNFTLPALGAVTTTSNTYNGILGTWASTGSTTSTKYATLSGSNVAALTGTAAADGSALTDVTGTANYDLAAGGGTVPSSMAANTIRYTGVAGTTAPGATLFSVNGLMNAGTGVWTIASGNVTIGLDRELVIHAANNGITLSGVIQDNGAGSSAVTITGTGVVTLGTANTYTGATTLNGTSAYGDGGKTIIVSALKNTGTASELGAGSSLALNGAVVQTGATGTSDRAITITGNSGVYVKGAYTQTLAGPISGPGNLSVDGDYNSGVPGGTGNLMLAADNSFTGDVVFQNDSRITLNHVNAVKYATLNLTNARVLADLTTYDLNYVIGGLKGSANLDLGSGNVSIGNNDQSTSYTGILSGAGSLTKIGNGTLTLTGANTYAGNTTVNGGVLATGSNSLPDTTKLTINGGKVAPTGIEIVDTLYFGAAQQAAGTWGASGSGADHIDDTHFAGTAGVIQVQPWSIASSTLAFGDVTLNDTTTLSVTITNLGSTPISGTASVSGAPFAVASGASWSVSVGGTTTVTVSFHPTATGSFPGTLTLIGGGLTRNVSLSGNGINFVQPTAANFQNYELDLFNMATPASTAESTLAVGGSLTQSFIPRRDNFLTGFSTRDAAAPTTCQLKALTFQSNDYQSTDSTIRFEMLRIETGGARTVIASQDLVQKLQGQDSQYTVTFTSPATLDFNTTYEIRVTLVSAEGAIHLYKASADYTDGALSTGGDLWFDTSGTAVIPVYPQLTIASDAANRFFSDVDPYNADSSQYDNLPGKFLGVGSAAERLILAHPAQWGPLTLEVEGGTYASAAAAGHSGTADQVDISGLAEGKAMLWVKSGTRVVGSVKLQAYPQRTVKLSYSYIQYPGESDHVLKTPAYANAVMAYISDIYAKVNIALDWTDNGVLTHEWDLDGDGISYEGDEKSEVWSPMYAGIIPNQGSVFSNLFMLRYDKNDSTFRLGGGGTSNFIGIAPPPALTSGYGAMVRGTLNRTVEATGSTLAHELGHNFGLYHSGYDNNFMAVGSDADEIFSWQWDVIHNTAQAIAQPTATPTIYPSPAPTNGGIGQAYNHTFQVMGGTPAYTWTVASGSLPPGLTLSGATLAGNPTTTGIYNFTLRVTDSLAATSTASFSVVIGNPNNLPPAFTANPINLSATEDAAFSGQLTATDANAGDTLTYSKVSGPAWLTVSSTGALSGTPGNSNVGANAFVVQVSDGMANVTAALNITVANVNDAPVFTTDPIGKADATENATYTGQTLAGSATDVDASDTLSYTKVSGPAWLTVASDGALGGMPGIGSAGLNTFTVRVTDSQGVTDEATLNITVLSGALPAQWTPADIGSGQLAGSVAFNAGTYTVSGSGSLVGVTSDKCYFVYQMLSGDGSIVARIPSYDSGSFNARMGVQIRDTLATNSKQLTMGVSGLGSYRLNYRLTTGGSTSNVAGSTATAPNIWVKLTRVGNVVTGYSSSDGSTWTSVGSQTVTLATNCYLGLVVASASDTALISTQFSNVTVTGAGSNMPPAFTADPINLSATEDAAFNGQLTASDPNTGDTLTYSKVSGPAWLTVSSTGALSGTPNNSNVGANAFVVQVTDGTASDTAALNITVNNVNDAPVFGADPINLAANEDDAFSGQLSASDVDAGASLSYGKVSGPAWLTVSSTGALSGTPGNGEVGANAFVVQVTDGMASVTAALNITVANVNDAPVFSADPINLNATEDAAFSGQVTATDIDASASLSYSKISGPVWLTVSATGALSGTPGNGEVGANAFVVQVTDGTANVTAALNITVSNVNDAPVFTIDPILAADASVNAAYTGQTLAGLATDTDAGDSVVFSKVSGPAWLSVATDGTLSGTPTSGNPGLNTFVVRATDDGATTDDAELRINVVSLPLPWTSGDIGTGMLAGSASHNSGTFTISGAGTIGGTSDRCHHVYQTLSGDGEIVARIPSYGSGSANARIGVQIRDTLAANSKQLTMGINGSGGYRWSRRTITGGTTTNTSSGSGTAPNIWVKLTRVGNVITAYKSSNGSSWTTVGSTSVTLATNCYIGLVVSSASATTLNTSQFANVTVTP